jgi:hypothetical protein
MNGKDDSLFESSSEFDGMEDDSFFFGGQKPKPKAPPAEPAKEATPEPVAEAAPAEPPAAEPVEEPVEEALAPAEPEAIVEAIVEEPETIVEEPEETEEPETVEEPVEEAVVEEPEPAPVPEKAEVHDPKPKVERKAPPAPKKAAAKPPAAKKKSAPLTPKQKVINNIYRKAGVESTPELAHLLREKQGTKVKISDLAVFIKEPENEVLADLFKGMSKINTVNLSAEVDINRIKVVGGQVLGAGRMYQPIQVAEIEGELQCTSGRHRLILLGLLYGPDAEISVYIEKMTLSEARDAVVVANMARKTKAMEQAEHAVLQAVGGNVDAGQDAMYTKTVTTKAKAKKYCTYTVLERHKPAKLGFKLGTKKEGGIATIRTIEGFWGNALKWRREMSRQEFDGELKASVEFLNGLATGFQAKDGFEADQHMASMTMSAIGKYYRLMVDSGGIIDTDGLVDAVVAMGEIGRQKSETTYDAIIEALRK